jgi:hypothetical protein
VNIQDVKIPTPITVDTQTKASQIESGKTLTTDIIPNPSKTTNNQTANNQKATTSKT